MDELDEVDEPLCGHGRRLWWNYGDGKPRHFSDIFGPVMVVCDLPPGDRSVSDA